jgi:peptidoglycan/xylan/chitin deacetylase (PgdA/CDA1 family)
MYYPVTIPGFVKKWIYPRYTFDIPFNKKVLYLTFDDGPHPSITPFVLDELKKHHAKATFFCIGKNVANHPAVYKRILEEGHSIGNHTYNHLNGWKTADDAYFKNIAEAAKLIDSPLFRPPYGRITHFQAEQLIEKWQYKIIMWSILSGDFDIKIAPEQCLKNVLKHKKPGSIIVFHDSEKAYNAMSYALPKLLEQLSEEGYVFDKISN